jgi:fructose-bisphosphate aldolase class II
MFSIAAAFGNVHGVYKSGNVVLSPHLLKGHQEFAKQQLNCAEDKVDLIVSSLQSFYSFSPSSW